MWKFALLGLHTRRRGAPLLHHAATGVLAAAGFASVNQHVLSLFPRALGHKRGIATRAKVNRHVFQLVRRACLEVLFHDLRIGGLALRTSHYDGISHINLLEILIRMHFHEHGGLLLLRQRPAGQTGQGDNGQRSGKTREAFVESVIIFHGLFLFRLFDVGFYAAVRAAPFIGYTDGDGTTQLLRKIPRDFRRAGAIPSQKLRRLGTPACEIFLSFIACKLIISRETSPALWGVYPMRDFRESSPRHGSSCAFGVKLGGASLPHLEQRADLLWLVLLRLDFH